MYKEIARKTGLKEEQVRKVIEEFLVFSARQAKRFGQFSLRGYITFFVSKLPPGRYRLPDGRVVWAPERETLRIKPLKKLKEAFNSPET